MSGHVCGEGVAKRRCKACQRERNRRAYLRRKARGYYSSRGPDRRTARPLSEGERLDLEDALADVAVAEQQRDEVLRDLAKRGAGPKAVAEAAGVSRDVAGYWIRRARLARV